MEQLLKRLRSGEAWLRNANVQLLAMEDVGVGSYLEAQFLDALELWDSLDVVLRNIYPEFIGCVLGEGKACGYTSVVRCRWCANTMQHGEAASEGCSG